MFKVVKNYKLLSPSVVLLMMRSSSIPPLSLVKRDKHPVPALSPAMSATVRVSRYLCLSAPCTRVCSMCDTSNRPHEDRTCWWDALTPTCNTDNCKQKFFLLSQYSWIHHQYCECKHNNIMTTYLTIHEGHGVPCKGHHLGSMHNMEVMKNSFMK